MIKQLEIENFRCFGQSTLSGFERVNLIGGQNNSGKTAFLEALYLNRVPCVQTVMALRGISEEILVSFPEKVWNGLFLNPDNPLKIVSNDNKNGFRTLKLSQQIIPTSMMVEIDEVLVTHVIKKELTTADVSEFEHLLFSSESLNLSILEILLESNENSSCSTIFSTKGMRKFAEPKLNLYPISFISATEKPSVKYLAEQYEKCFLQGYSEKIKTAFNIIDLSIYEVRTLMSSEPTIYLSRKNQRPMSIALFGDAMNRVAHFALELINNQASILLVDEIENGIHHSHQKQLWQWLFALAVELDVQIFATTHSLEMLTAFKEAAMGTQYESEVAYFEFARHVKTQEIIAIKREIDNLDYALERNKEIRGE